MYSPFLKNTRKSRSLGVFNKLTTKTTQLLIAETVGNN